MADVKRYDRRICSCDYPSDEMELSDDGDYVAYDDYASLRASHDALMQELNDMLIIAKFDDWEYATTGRSVVFKRAMDVLAKADGV